MTPFERDTGSVVGINVQLTLATLFGWLAWLWWPTSAEWWGIGVGCVIFALAALAGVGNALKMMLELHRRRRVLAEFMAQGGAPKTARLASIEDLERTGMVQ